MKKCTEKRGGVWWAIPNGTKKLVGEGKNALTYDSPYVGMMTLLMGSIITCGSPNPSQKVGMVDFFHIKNKESIVFIDYKCIENEKAFEKIKQKFWKEMYPNFWNGKSFGQRDSCKAYTQQEMNDLLHDNNKDIFLQSLQVDESDHETAQQGWRADNIYFLDTQGNVASDTKANYFSGKAKVLSMDRNTSNIDTLNDGNNDNDDFKMPILNNDNSNNIIEVHSDTNDKKDTISLQNNRYNTTSQDNKTWNNINNTTYTNLKKGKHISSEHSYRATNNINVQDSIFPIAKDKVVGCCLAVLFASSAFIGWVASQKQPTQGNPKDQKAISSRTEEDYI